MTQCWLTSTLVETLRRIVVLPRRMCSPQTARTASVSRFMRRTSLSFRLKRQSKCALVSRPETGKRPSNCCAINQIAPKSKLCIVPGMSAFFRACATVLLVLAASSWLLQARPPATLGDPPPAPTPEEVARLRKQGPIALGPTGLFSVNIASREEVRNFFNSVYAAAGKSNIALGNAGPDAITAYIEDFGGNNAAAGHRRWIL